MQQPIKDSGPNIIGIFTNKCVIRGCKPCSAKFVEFELYRNAFHGTSSIDLNSNNTVNIVNYGLGTACGGSIHSFKGSPFRSFEGGVASIKQDLTIDESTLIGNYDAQNVYSVETIGDRVYVGTYDGYVKVLTENNIEIADYKVGDFPGDFEMWRK